MSVRTFDGVDELASAVGSHLGYSSWRTITTDQVVAFADVIGDRPFETSMDYSYLTLTQLPALLNEIYEVEGIRIRVNYGVDRVRFAAPVRIGSRIRGGIEFLGLRPVPAGQPLSVRVTVECEGSDEPACVADILSLVVP